MGVVPVARGREFAEAVQSSTGKPVLAGERASDPSARADMVRALTGRIHSLFTDLDAGRMSMDAFRGELFALGVEETAEARRLLSQTPLSFTQLLKALMSDSSNLADVAAGARRFPVPDTTYATSDRRAPPPKPDEDVISWRDGPVVPTRSAKGPGEFGSGGAIPSGGLWAGSDSKALLYSGATATAERSGGKAGVPAKALKESGVGQALWGAAELDSRARFETVTQAESRRGVGAEGVVGTSAGYYSADGGFVREQIYSLVRQLDGGSLSTRDFRVRVAQLGVSPLPVLVEKLILEFEANGRANFPRFVRAFEDYFAANTVAVESVSAKDEYYPGKEDADKAAAGGARGKGKVSDFVPAAKSSHGDIVSWSGSDVMSEEDRRAQIREGITPAARRRADAAPAATFRDPVTWAGTDSSVDIIGYGRPYVVSKRDPGPGYASQRSAGNFLTWAGGVDPSEAAADVGPRGKALTSLSYTRAAYAPFGTEADLRAPPSAERPQIKRSTAFTQGTTGDWMSHPETAGTLPRKSGLR